LYFDTEIVVLSVSLINYLCLDYNARSHIITNADEMLMHAIE